MTAHWTKRTKATMLAVIVTALFPLAALPLATSAGNDLLTGTALAADPDSGLQATIRRTSHGIPHITANDFGGVGFGYGYAVAQDNICVLADIYVTVNGERSKYSGSSPLGSMGPDGSWSQGGNGTAPEQPQQRLLLPARQGPWHDREPARAAAAARPAARSSRKACAASCTATTST